MNTVNDLFDKICTKENILLAIHKAARGKTKEACSTAGAS